MSFLKFQLMQQKYVPFLVIMIFQAMVKFVKLHNYGKINFQKIIFFILCKTA